MLDLRLTNGKKPQGNNGILHVTTSTPTDKLAGVLRIDSSSLDNLYCIKMSKKPGCICVKCYGQCLEKRYTDYGVYCKYNSDILSSKLLTAKNMPVFTRRDIVRFNGNGEIVNMTHLLNLFAIAGYNPDTQFALWTKRKELVWKCVSKYGINVIPSNCTMVYSNPDMDDVMVDPPKHFDIVFNVVTAAYAIDNNLTVNCGNKKCIQCKNCYGGKCLNNGMVYVNKCVIEILKSDLNKYLKSGGMIC